MSQPEHNQLNVTIDRELRKLRGQDLTNEERLRLEQIDQMVRALKVGGLTNNERLRLIKSLKHLLILHK